MSVLMLSVLKEGENLEKLDGGVSGHKVVDMNRISCLC